MINIIAAVSKNGVIGNKNRLPWKLPEDLKYFNETTIGHPIVMGEKNF
jgi:dihydrofolate reductase